MALVHEGTRDDCDRNRYGNSGRESSVVPVVHHRVLDLRAHTGTAFTNLHQCSSGFRRKPIGIFVAHIWKWRVVPCVAHRENPAIGRRTTGPTPAVAIRGRSRFASSRTVHSTRNCGPRIFARVSQHSVKLQRDRRTNRCRLTSIDST